MMADVLLRFKHMCIFTGFKVVHDTFDERVSAIDESLVGEARSAEVRKSVAAGFGVEFPFTTMISKYIYNILIIYIYIYILKVYILIDFLEPIPIKFIY